MRLYSSAGGLHAADLPHITMRHAFPHINLRVDAGVGRQLRMILTGRENANLSAFGQERHSPLQHNEKSIGEANQRVNMYCCPDQPGRKSGEAQKS